VRHLPALVVACFAIACGSSSAPAGSAGGGSNGGGSDGGTTADAGGSPDAGTADAGPGGSTDGGAADGGAPDAGPIGGGGPAPLTSGESAMALAPDDANVYWSSFYRTPAPNGHDTNIRYAVRGMPKSGSGSVTTYVETAGGPRGAPVADGAFVYWLNIPCSFFPCEEPPVDLHRAARAGGPVENLARLSFNSARLDLDPSSIFVAKYSAAMFGETGRITRLPKAGGSEATIISGEDVRDVAVLADGLYWTTTDGVRKRDPDGRVGALASVRGGAERFKVDGNRIYLRAYSNDVVAAPRGGGETTVIWHAPNGTLHDVDANAGVVYWVQDAGGGSKGCLGRANGNGTDARCLDTAGATYSAVRVDDTAVFFVRDGNVYRLAR